MILLAILGVVVLVVLWSLERRNKNRTSRINLDDLLIGDDGKASKAAFVMHGSFIVTSWVIVFQTLNKTLSDMTFTAYIAAWVIPAVAKLIKGAPPNATVETTISQTTVTPQGTNP